MQLHKLEIIKFDERTDARTERRESQNSDVDIPMHVSISVQMCLCLTDYFQLFRIAVQQYYILGISLCLEF